jgi:hypothetical protein
METTDRLDRWIPRLMVVTILAVAVFAFVQSYTHVYYLGQTHHETGASLRMLPLSVDWLMFAAGLTRLHVKRKGIRHWFPPSALALGAIATLIANVAFGVVFGWESAAIAAWAPVVLFVTVELGMLLVRTAKAKAPEPTYVAQVAERQAELDRFMEFTKLTQPQPAPDPSPETATFPRQVDSPEPALEGWGQLAADQAALAGDQAALAGDQGRLSEPAGQPEALERRPGLNGIGLRNRGQ